MSQTLSAAPSLVLRRPPACSASNHPGGGDLEVEGGVARLARRRRSSAPDGFPLLPGACHPLQQRLGGQTQALSNSPRRNSLLHTSRHTSGSNIQRALKSEWQASEWMLATQTRERIGWHVGLDESASNRRGNFMELKILQELVNLPLVLVILARRHSPQ